jgi:hypothetical protein
MSTPFTMVSTSSRRRRSEPPIFTAGNLPEDIHARIVLSLLRSIHAASFTVMNCSGSVK